MVVEEPDPYTMVAAKLGPIMIFLTSNSSSTKFEYIVSKCSGFVYIVSVYRVTRVHEY
jgi:tryptophan synthase alpha subunit